MSVSKSDGLSVLVSRVFGDQNDTALEEGAAASKPLRSTHDHSNQQMNGHTRDLESGMPSPARSEINKATYSECFALFRRGSEHASSNIADDSAVNRELFY